MVAKLSRRPTKGKTKTINKDRLKEYVGTLYFVIIVQEYFMCMRNTLKGVQKILE